MAMREIEKCQKAIADERDKLDAMIDELSVLRDSCRSAYDGLNSARSSLSKFV